MEVTHKDYYDKPVQLDIEKTTDEIMEKITDASYLCRNLLKGIENEAAGGDKSNFLDELAAYLIETRKTLDKLEEGMAQEHTRLGIWQKDGKHVGIEATYQKFVEEAAKNEE